MTAAQKMLDRVIHTTDNLDEKVGRVFTSMSFLTVGATILFTNFVNNKLLSPVEGVDLVSVFFLGFVISVAVATAYMLQAMGPRFRLILRDSRVREGEPVNPSPTGYADKIASLNAGDWTDYFRSITPHDFYERWYAESIKEAYLLSKKVERKVGEMKKAQRWFVLAIVLLVVMVTLAIYPMF